MARRVLRSVVTPQWRRGLRHGVAPVSHHSKLPLSSDYRSVIDVGAHQGQFALFARWLAPHARVVSFEPLARPAATFQRVLGGDERVQLVRAAVGDQHGKLKINVTADDDSSSALPITARQVETYGTGSRVVRQVEVSVTTLDRFFAEVPEGPILLKLDIQGFELRALQGAERLIRSVDSVLIECSFEPFYEDQPLFGATHDWLGSRGFSLVGGHLTTTTDDGRWQQGDFLFERLGTPRG